MTIKAIETRYKGYRFRSRLEARWAIFFDAVGLEWEYEKQGYQLPSGLYLPDFWFPYQSGPAGWGEWVEIKPLPLTEKESSLLAELVEMTGHRAYAICGQPWPDQHAVFVFQHHHGGKPPFIPFESNAILAESPVVGAPINDNWQLYLHCPQRNFCFLNSDRWNDAPVLQQAFEAARSARFEHGETPK